MSEERKLYEDWLHKSPEFGETIVSAWDVWQARAALAQPEPAAPTVVEPVAYQWLDTSVIRKRIPKSAEADAWRPLYLATPPRVALTVDQIIEATRHIDSNAPGLFVVIARAVEAAHGIGETK